MTVEQALDVLGAEGYRCLTADEAVTVRQALADALASQFFDGDRHQRALALLSPGGRDLREVTMQDRLLVMAHIETIADENSSFQVIADTMRECVRCCDHFPRCVHVADEAYRVRADERPAEPLPARPRHQEDDGA